MKSHLYIYIPLFALLFQSCIKDKITYAYKSDTLKIIQLSEKVYQHTSYLKTQSFGNVPCNGMLVIDQNQAIVVDTPTDDAVTVELMNWLQVLNNYEIKAVVATHFHEDCLGGLNAFHQEQIPSYASNKTIALAKEAQFPIPQIGFDSIQQIDVGAITATLQFFGEGHTIDNCVVHVPSEQALFGGCLIKTLKAGKGNLADANTQSWSETVAKIQTTYPDIQLVIPGHGPSGDAALLEYTRNLFK
ncbi:subclass B1 metallo-beta-lactamase [Urechidicola sp. KH5]